MIEGVSSSVRVIRQVAMAKKKDVKDPLLETLARVIDKLKDQGALLVIGLYLCAIIASLSGAASPEMAFGTSSFLSITYLIFKALHHRSQERIEALKLDSQRAIELEKLRAKAIKLDLPKVLPKPEDLK